MFFFIKVIASAIIIGIITWIAKKNPVYGGYIAALPLVSLLSIMWLSLQGESSKALSHFISSVLWAFPATAILLLIVKVMMKHEMSLPFSLLVGTAGWAAVLWGQHLLIR